MIFYTKRKVSDRSFVNRAITMIGMMALLAAVVIFAQQQGDLIADSDSQVAGEWVGILTEDYDSEIRYDLRVDLIQEGNILAGALRFASTNNAITITSHSAITGNVTDDTVTLQEIDMIDLQGISADSWCWIAIELDFEDLAAQDTLVGTWHGIETPGVDRCLPTQGRVMLTRAQ